MRSVVTINPIGSQVSGVPYNVSGSIAYFPVIKFSDDGTNFNNANVSSTPLATATWQFTHPGMPVNATTLISFEAEDGTSNIASSNIFSVVNPHTITPNVPVSATAATPFVFTGSLGGYSAIPAMTVRIDNGVAVPLGGVTQVGWTTSLTIATSGLHTITVSDGFLSATTSGFSVAAASGVVTPPPPVSGTATVWDAAHKSTTVTISNASGTATTGGSATAGSTPQSVLGNVAIAASGLIAFEITANAITTNWAAGVADHTFNLGSGAGLGGDVDGLGYYINNPPQQTWFNAGLVNASSGADATGAIVTFVVSGLREWVSTPKMRANGFNWNNSGTADPATGVGGVLMTGIGTPLYPCFNTMESGGSANLNGGATAFSPFLTSYMAAHSAIKALDGAIVSGSGSGSGSVSGVSGTPGLRQFQNNPGGDGTFWVQPFQTSANWIVSGSMVTALRNGSFGSPTGHINVRGNFAAPFYVGKASDPLVTVTNGSKTIHVRIPLGAVVETPNSGTDNSIGGADTTQPYLVWSISGASINTGSVQATGSVITGTYGMTLMDGAGLMMVDAVTNNQGTANSFGGITQYDLDQLAANPDYVGQHMLAYSLDPSIQVSNQGPAWPLETIDTSFPNNGPMPQGLTIGIPASTPMPSGLSTGGKYLFRVLQQFGAIYYNVAGNGCTSFFCYDEAGTHASLVTDFQNSISNIMQYVSILHPGDAPNYNSGPAGAQYSLATTKGAVSGSSNAFPAPALLDLSPTGGVNVAPHTFGAWYPSGYDVTPTGGSSSGGGITASRLTDFLGTIGVNGQVQSNITNYVSNPATTVADAQFIGARLWRDGLQTGSGQLAVFGALASAGFGFSFVPWTGAGNPYTVDPAALVGLATTIQHAVSGKIKWLEGPNEPTNWPISYNGNVGGGTGTWGPLADFQHAYYVAIHGASALSGVLVASITETEGETDNVGLQYPTIPAGGGGTSRAGGTTYFDVYNPHLYPEYDGTISYVSPAGDQFNAQMTKDFVSTNSGHFAGLPLATVNAAPKIMTEFGIRQSVNAAVRGKNIMRAYLDAYMKGFGGMFIYELYDEGDGYGLFNGHGSPTTAATYMHNLTTILNDSSSTFTPGSLAVGVSGLPANGNFKLFQKSDGTFYGVLWRDETDYNLGTNTVISVSGATVSVTIPGTGNISVFDPTVGTTATSTHNSVSGVTVSVADYPMVVSISQTQATSHSITPVSPGTVTAGQSFTFHGAIGSYASVPTLLLEVDNGAPSTLAGVTISGWSTSLSLSVVGTHTLLVTDGTVTGSTSVVVQAASGSGGVSGIPRVTAPLPGPVTKGTWSLNQRLNVAAMPNGFMAYDILLPAQYDPTKLYPIMVYGHENDEGMSGNSYPNSNLAVTNGAIGAGLSADSCFNTVAFRTAFPCIVIAPYCDQSINSSGADGNSNFGGYLDTPNSGGNEQGVLALVRSVASQFSVDLTRIYITGDSLGAIGALAQMADNNAYGTGTVNHVFAAGMGFSDQLFRPNGVPNQTVFQAMSGVPYLAIGTPDDNNESSYDQAAWNFYTGNSNFPSEAAYTSGGVAALRAGSTQFYYMHDPDNVPWNDGYRQLNADGGKGTALYTWLFSQMVSGAAIGGGGSTGGNPGGGTNPTESVNNTIVTPTTAQIIDSQGNVWAINAGGVITVNGTPDNTSANVQRLVYENHTIWQQNAALMWWSKTSPGAGWTPALGTTTSPLSNAAPSANKATLIAPTAAVLTDVSGNAYGINNAQVAINGVVDTGTSHVVELAYVAGVLWQENVSGVWFGKSSPTAAWSPSGGTTTSPLASGSGGGGTPTGQFHVSSGQIIDPNGKVFIAAGINIYANDLASAISNANCQPLTTMFPGVNFVRVPVYQFDDPSSFAQQIAWATAKGIVIELEDHSNTTGGNAGGNVGTIFTGAQLTQELNWYASVAAAYKSNPYVWFGTNNEPATQNGSGQFDPNGLANWQLQTVQAVRNAGNNSIVMLEAVGWDTPQSYGQYVTLSAFGSVSNCIVDLHVYGQAYSGTTPGAIAPVINSNIAFIQANQHSADGVMPVLIGEFGNATDGQNFDSNGAQTVTAVMQVAGSTSAGFAAWNWAVGNGDIDALRSGNGSLTDYGQQVATGIAQAAATR